MTTPDKPKITEGFFVDCPNKESFLTSLEKYNIINIQKDGNTLYGIKENMVFRYTLPELEPETQLHTDKHL